MKLFVLLALFRFYVHTPIHHTIRKQHVATALCCRQHREPRMLTDITPKQNSGSLLLILSLEIPTQQYHCDLIRQHWRHPTSRHTTAGSPAAATAATSKTSN